MKVQNQGETAKDSFHTPAKSQFAPRPFAPQVEVREPPSAESLERAARFGISFADVDIFPRPVVQPKLVVGPVGDRCEREADRVARQVVERISSSDQESVPMQEELEDEDELDLEEGEELRRKVTGIGLAEGAEVGPELESAIQRAQGSGQPLSDGVRQPMERAFGADFRGVRVHTDGEADSLNRSLQARAFTTGRDIFLRRGEYHPASSEGQRLLAHELTHVVQQNRGSVHRAHTQSRRLTNVAVDHFSYNVIQRGIHNLDDMNYYDSDIYGITDKTSTNTDEVIYVGQTAQELFSRFYQHATDVGESDQPWNTAEDFEKPN